jgi:sugar lactone lactonase YvrE
MSFGYAVYFTERARNRVVRWDPDTGDADVVAGESRDPEGQLSDPYGLTFSGGDLVVADKFHHRLCRVRGKSLRHWPLTDPDRHRARRVDSPAYYNPDELLCPTSLFGESSGAVLCTFFEDHTIYRIYPDGRLELVLGVVRNVPHLKDEPRSVIPAEEARQTPLWGPTGVVERADGTIFFVERDSQIVREYHPDRGLRAVFDFAQRGRSQEASESPLEGSVQDYSPPSPCSLGLDGEGRLYVCDPVHSCVLRLDHAGKTFRRVVMQVRNPDAYIDRGPVALAFGPDGTAWLADSSSQSIQAYDPGGEGEWTPRPGKLTSVAGEALVLAVGGMGLVMGP